MRDSENPTLKTVLLEDGAAVTGVGIAALGLLASRITGSTRWTGWRRS